MPFVPSPPSQNRYIPSQRQQELQQRVLVRNMLLVGFVIQIISIETGMSPTRIREMRRDLLESGYRISMSRRANRSSETILKDQTGKLHAALFIAIYKNMGDMSTSFDELTVEKSLNIQALLQAYRLYCVVLKEIPPSNVISLERSLNVNDAWLLCCEFRSGKKIAEVWDSIESELETIDSQGSLIEIEDSHDQPEPKSLLRPTAIPPPSQRTYELKKKQQEIREQLTARFLLLAGFTTQIITIQTGLKDKPIRAMRKELSESRYNIRLNRRTFRTSRTIVESQAGKLHASIFMTIYHKIGEVGIEAGEPCIISSININLLLKAFSLYTTLLQEMPQTNLISWNNWLSISDAWSLARELRAGEATMFNCSSCKTDYYESANQDTLIDCPYCKKLLPSSNRVIEATHTKEEVA